MPKPSLITGGAGFIGSHLAHRVLASGHRVRVLDSLIEQVHGEARARPRYLSPRVELCVSDVRNPTDVAAALPGADHVFHLAALVGVGQSLYQAAAVFVDPRDAPALGRASNDLLNGPDRQRELGANARARAGAYGVDVMAEHYLGLYRSLARQSSRQRPNLEGVP